MSAFLTSVLAEASFPVPVAPAVLDTYASRFPSAVVKNPILAAHASRLLALHLPVADRRALVCSGSLKALDAVLASDERSIGVLADILRSYSLSPTDQLRFVDRPLAGSIADWVRECSRFTYEAQALAQTNRLPEPRSRYLFNLIGAVTKDPTSRVRFPRLIPSEPLGHYENFIAHHVADLGDDTWTDLMRPVLRGPVLTHHLGAGRSPQSRAAWAAFLTLVKDDPDVSLKTMLESAAALGRAPQ